MGLILEQLKTRLVSKVHPSGLSRNFYYSSRCVQLYVCVRIIISLYRVSLAALNGETLEINSLRDREKLKKTFFFHFIEIEHLWFLAVPVQRWVLNLSQNRFHREIRQLRKSLYSDWFVKWFFFSADYYAGQSPRLQLKGFRKQKTRTYQNGDIFSWQINLVVKFVYFLWKWLGLCVQYTIYYCY